MNIFGSLRKYVQMKDKLMYDAKGNAFLYNSKEKIFKTVTIHDLKDFKPCPYDCYITKPSKEENSTYDKILIYSVKVGETTIDGITKPIFRYGFINKEGYAITHASYDKVHAFVNGQARVYIDKKYCFIDLSGHPVVDGIVFNNVEFVTQFTYSGFAICSTDGKYGLINRYYYQCLPCEYDCINLRKTYDYDFFEVRRNNITYTAFIAGGTICNIVNICPKTIRKKYDFLLIEEISPKGDGNFLYGLLNSGGFRILKSEYDLIDVVYENVCIVSKGNFKQLFFVWPLGCKLELDKCNDIHFGIGYNDELSRKYLYAAYNSKDLKYLVFEDKDGSHNMDNYSYFWPENLEDEYDEIYFTQEEYNNYIAVVVGDKTEVVDLFGNVIIPLVIPSKYKVITDKFSEGIFGIKAKVQKQNLDGSVYEKEYYSYINSDGKILTDFIYDGIGKFKDGEAEAYFDTYSSTYYHTIDKNGNLINEYHISYPDDDIQENNIDKWRDDAFEGDSDAYWNID